MSNLLVKGKRRPRHGPPGKPTKTDRWGDRFYARALSSKARAKKRARRKMKRASRRKKG